MTPGRVAGLAILATLTACASGNTGPSGRWIGSVTSTTANPQCATTRAVLQIRDRLVKFEPNEGTWILEGEARQDGSLYADHSTIGADKKPYLTTLEATWTQTSVNGTYTTPRCSFTVALARPPT